MQSVFGIGILFLGTPTLLILGYSFPDTLSIGLDVELELFVALMLLAYFVIRSLPNSASMLQDNIRRFSKVWLCTIGTVHGFSNLGGSLLAIFAANTFQDKKTIRNRIAFCYLYFAAIRLTVLAILTPNVMHFGQLGYAALAGVIFIVIERHIFKSISSPVFDRIFTILIGGYSAVLFLRLFRVIGPVGAA